MSELSPIEKALETVGGNKSKLARLVKCSPSNITNIIARGGSIPCRSKRDVKKWTEATKLKKEELFPQIY